LEVDEAALLELQGEWADVFETLKTTTGSA
jgi:hypothetical protein